MLKNLRDYENMKMRYRINIKYILYKEIYYFILLVYSLYIYIYIYKIFTISQSLFRYFK